MAVQGAKRRPAAAAGTASRWRDALSDERMAHLVKTAFRETSRALQVRLAKHSIQYGHWTLLRVLWKGDGITQRELSDRPASRSRRRSSRCDKWSSSATWRAASCPATTS
jgi:hypothetical protein